MVESSIYVATTIQIICMGYVCMCVCKNNQFIYPVSHLGAPGAGGCVKAGLLDIFGISICADIKV